MRKNFSGELVDSSPEKKSSQSNGSNVVDIFQPCFHLKLTFFFTYLSLFLFIPVLMNPELKGMELESLPLDVLGTIFRKLGKFPSKDVIKFMSVSRVFRRVGTMDFELWTELNFSKIPQIRESDALLAISHAQDKVRYCSFSNCTSISDRVLHALSTCHTLSSLHAGSTKLTGLAILDLLTSLQQKRKQFPLKPFDDSNAEFSCNRDHRMHEINGCDCCDSSALPPIPSRVVSSSNTVDNQMSNSVNSNVLSSIDVEKPIASCSLGDRSITSIGHSPPSSSSPTSTLNLKMQNEMIDKEDEKEGVNEDKKKSGMDELVLAHVYSQVGKKNVHARKGRNSVEIHRLHQLQLELLQDQMEMGMDVRKEEDVEDILLSSDEEVEGDDDDHDDGDSKSSWDEDGEEIWQENDDDEEAEEEEKGNDIEIDMINWKNKGKNIIIEEKKDLIFSSDRVNSEISSSHLSHPTSSSSASSSSSSANALIHTITDSKNDYKIESQIQNSNLNGKSISQYDKNSEKNKKHFTHLHSSQPFIPSMDESYSKQCNDGDDKEEESPSSFLALHRLWLEGCDRVTKTQFEQIRRLVQWVDVDVCKDCSSLCIVHDCQMCDLSFCASCRNVSQCCICNTISCSELSCVKCAYCQVCKSSHCQNCRKSWDCERCCTSFCENHIISIRICYIPFRYCDVCWEEMKVTSFFWSCIGCM